MGRDGPDSPDVVTAKRLLDELRARGFTFTRTAPGPDGPLMGRRATEGWVDTIYLGGFSHDCAAWRTPSTSLILVGQGKVERLTSGGAISVLGEVLAWQGGVGAGRSGRT